MYQRGSVDTLGAHLEKAHGISVTKVSQLDVGVFRVDRNDKGAPLVARLFSTARSHAAAEADLAVLRYLAEIGFPAEQPFEESPLSSHQGQAVLVTEFVKQVPKAKRPPFPILTLGAMIGRLHGLDAIWWPVSRGGAIHGAVVQSRPWT
jgi:Ser/Thr protein kinase RdoA (MazF antagonist)